MTDCREEFIARVQSAASSGRGLYIEAGGSKRALVGRACSADTLDISGHNGITDYQSDELVISARAATPLAELQVALSERDQMLPFEPPLFGNRATLGGTLASNLSGPARPYTGSVRDMVLGLELINGRAEVLNFGGVVMKNVAGYDVSRLQAGALGTLGLITEIHLKVLPQPEDALTLAFEMKAEAALQTMNRRALEPRPLSGACWYDGILYLRLWGASAAVRHTAGLWGGEILTPDAEPWGALREMTLPFFTGDETLWRLSTAATTPLGELPQLLDWGGALRWFRGDDRLGEIRQLATLHGGHVSLFRGGDRAAEVRQSPGPVQQRLQRLLKQAFDPQGIFNPGRLYSWM